jgi:hypothetical protein
MANLEDARGRYTFESFTRNGKTYKQACGWLGIPDQVITHRSPSEQRKVAGGTGDDAGHLIGNRFGSPGGGLNLSQQNWKANRYGTYSNLESAWAAKRLQGIEIYVQVTDVFRFGETRPFLRNVQWTESVNGHEANFAVDFANTHTPESRTAQHIPPTNLGGKDGDVIHVDFKARRRTTP